jgi:hypothetical protein
LLKFVIFDDFEQFLSQRLDAVDFIVQPPMLLDGDRPRAIEIHSPMRSIPVRSTLTQRERKTAKMLRQTILARSAAVDRRSIDRFDTIEEVQELRLNSTNGLPVTLTLS